MRIPRAFASAVLSAALLLPTGAAAQLVRTYLASSGDDANPCTLVQPCRWLHRALAAVADEGEIVILGTGVYNTTTVAIAKSVSIIANPGVKAAVESFSTGPAIGVLTSGLQIVIRNLSILGWVGNYGGIQLLADSELTLESSLIHEIEVGNGIWVEAGGRLNIVDTTFENITGAGGYGLYLEGSATVNVVGSRFHGSFGGIIADANVPGGSIRVAVTDCTFSISQAAIHAVTWASDSQVRFHITGSTFVGAPVGVSLSAHVGTASVLLKESLLVGNTLAWQIDGPNASVESAGDNLVAGNGGSVGALTPVAPQ